MQKEIELDVHFESGICLTYSATAQTVKNKLHINLSRIIFKGSLGSVETVYDPLVFREEDDITELVIDSKTLEDLASMVGSDDG